MGQVETYGKKVLMLAVLLMALAFILRQSFVPDSVKGLFRY